MGIRECLQLLQYIPIVESQFTNDDRWLRKILQEQLDHREKLGYFVFSKLRVTAVTRPADPSPAILKAFGTVRRALKHKLAV